MSRRKHRIERPIPPDPIYNSELVSKLINYVMRKGKKTIARKIVYGAFDIIREKTKKDPLEVFQKAIENAGPYLEVRPRRIGGATYQVPVEVPDYRRITLAMKWMILGAKQKRGKPMKEKLAEEIIAASKGEGFAVKKKEDLHKMAEANKAFTHFAW
jgi:small subunit ribosomal protein S7